jgi:hypothetical protein
MSSVRVWAIAKENFCFRKENSCPAIAASLQDRSNNSSALGSAYKFVKPGKELVQLSHKS